MRPRKNNVIMQMCGSIKDSIISGLLIYGAAAIFLFSGFKEYIWLGAFLFVIGTMQFLDALIWVFKALNLPTKSIAQYGVIIILILELLAAYVGYVYYSGKRMPIFEILLLITTILMIILWIMKCNETIITNDGYLKWCNIDIHDTFKILFLGLLLFPFLYFPNMAQKLLLIAAISGLWLYNYNHDAFGSRWCYSMSIYSIFAVILFFAREGI